MSSDEGGFLYVAQHWTAGGGSLYGRYWVDRPPLLIVLFQVGNQFGGLTGLRVLGCVAAGVTVQALGLAAHRLLGERAAMWTALVACSTITAPLLGAVNVNGELLATPFVALGILACAEAVTATTDVRRLRMGFAVGACAAAAVMVKQNVGDVAVFASAFGLTARRSGRRRRSGEALYAACCLAGAVTGCAVVLALAASRGTSPGGVFFAMYPFRIRATGPMGQLSLSERLAHLERLCSAWVATGAPLLFLLLAVAIFRGRLPKLPHARPLACATVALAAFDAFSVAAGGAYWSHYLVQLVPATALTAGVLAPLSRAGRALVAMMLVVCGASWVFGLPHRVDVPGQTIGEAIRNVSLPGDTVVSLLGSADIVEASGLSSPYRYLWSLPSRTLDQRMTVLAATFDSSDPPTWVIVRGPKTLEHVENSMPGHVFVDSYQRLPDVCGRQVYLRDDVHRTTPHAAGCRRPLSPLLMRRQ